MTKIVLFSATGFDWTSGVMMDAVFKNFDDVQLVQVNKQSAASQAEIAEARKRKIQKKGYVFAASRLADRYLNLRKIYAEIESVEQKSLQQNFGINYPEIKQRVQAQKAITVDTTNGVETENTLKNLAPDIIIQCGAGILRPNVFTQAKKETLNLHCGIAPYIRGGSSVFWSLYFGKRGWVGPTVHGIVEKIDAGPIYKQEVVDFNYGIHPAALFTLVANKGIGFMLEAATELLNNTATPVKINEKGVYKSFYSSKEFNQLKNNNWFPVKSL